MTVLDQARPASGEMAGVPSHPVVRDWTLTRAHRLWSMQPRGRLGPYYIHWDACADGIEAPKRYRFDANGIRVDHSPDDHDPVLIAQYALDLHAHFLETHSERSGSSFLLHARWLRDNVNGDGGYPMPTARPLYGARAGYLSARAQGLAISVLIRAHQLEPREDFLDAAISAVRPMLRDVADGGVVWRSSNGDTFLEDVAVSPAVHRLDGCLVGCWGLFELPRVAFQPRLYQVLGPTIGTLLRRLEVYDAGHWSYETALVASDGTRRYASFHAHELHIALLLVFASMIDASRLAAVARAWAKRIRTPRVRRLVVSEPGLRAVARRVASNDDVANGAVALF
ncbi:MAG: hypothetical protein NVS4B5_01650 [Vulcanimicrobiaceae bacterium]